MCTFYHQGSNFNKMKFIIAVLVSTFFIANNYAVAGPLDKLERKLDRLFGKEIESGADIKATKKKKPQEFSNQQNSQPCNNKRGALDKLEGSLDKLFGKEIKTKSDAKCFRKNRSVKKIISKTKISSFRDENPQNVSFYTGTFDTKDERGDDETSLFGVEHKNKNLFRSTWLGRLSPTTGAFVTKKNSVYLYTGIEADYNVGLVNISPSFAPGYYQAGNGKNLGSALEFKSELKIGVDLFKNTNLGYSYSHISNNDWGDVNPGTDNQTLTLSKKF